MYIYILKYSLFIYICIVDFVFIKVNIFFIKIKNCIITQTSFWKNEKNVGNVITYELNLRIT